jgi:hypothetical protein
VSRTLEAPVVLVVRLGVVAFLLWALSRHLGKVVDVLHLPAEVLKRVLP